MCHAKSIATFILPFVSMPCNHQRWLSPSSYHSFIRFSSIHGHSPTHFTTPPSSTHYKFRSSIIHYLTIIFQEELTTWEVSIHWASSLFSTCSEETRRRKEGIAMGVRLCVIGLAIMTKGLGVSLHPILTAKLEFSLISRRTVFTINLDFAINACMHAVEEQYISLFLYFSGFYY